MPIKTWSVYTAGTAHTIQLNHGYFSGRRQITIDGEIVHTSRNAVDYGSTHAFELDGVALELAIQTNGITYQYYLIQEGVPQPTDAERQSGKTSTDLLRLPALAVLTFWHELGRFLGMRYRAMPGAAWALRHRLWGVRQGYPLTVRAGYRGGSLQPGYWLAVRHEPLDTPEQIARLRADERLQALNPNLKKSADDLQSADGVTQFLLPAVRGESASEVAMRVQTFLSAIFTHTRPLALEGCENPDCPHLAEQTPDWVMNASVPRYLCPSCASSFTAGDVSDDLMSKRPGPRNLFAGLVIAVAVAILGAVVWAFIGFTFNLIASLTAFFILSVMLWLMRKVGTRIDALSIIAAGVLTALSVTLGHVLLSLMFVLREGVQFSLPAFLYAADLAVADLQSLTNSYLMTALATGSYLWAQFKRADLTRKVTPLRGGIARG